MVYGLDEVDRRILYGLMVDARGTSAPELAADLDVSPATIRNRISKLEAADVVTGYRAAVNFERADGRIANLYLCNAPVADRETYAARVQEVPGVVHVRELMTGRRNLHVLAVGKDTRDLRAVARAITALEIEIEDEDLVQTETDVPYAPYGPDDGPSRKRPDEFVRLAGGAEIVEVTAAERAPIAGRTLASVRDRQILADDTLVIAVRRDDGLLTPNGDTRIEAGDRVTLFSADGVPAAAIDAFSTRRRRN